MRFILSLVVFLMLAVMPTMAQTPIEVECGDILEDEFTSGGEQHVFEIDLNAGDILTMESLSISGVMSSQLVLYDPNENRLEATYTLGNPNSVDPTLVSDPLPTNGTFTIYHTSRNSTSTGVGIHTLFVSCTLRDGTVIAPGDTITTVGDDGTQVETTVTDPSIVPAPDFGIPGLPPVDLSNVARFPLTVGAGMNGGLSPTGSEVLGYSFEGTADQRLNLTVQRVSGNLNIGVAVIDSESNLIHFSAMVTTEATTSRLHIPANGEYTVSVFRLNLSPPDNPEATAFAVQIDTVE